MGGRRGGCIFLVRTNGLDSKSKWPVYNQSKLI